MKAADFILLEQREDLFAEEQTRIILDRYGIDPDDPDAYEKAKKALKKDYNKKIKEVRKQLANPKYRSIRNVLQNQIENLQSRLNAEKDYLHRKFKGFSKYAGNRTSRLSGQTPRGAETQTPSNTQQQQPTQRPTQPQQSSPSTKPQGTIRAKNFDTSGLEAFFGSSGPGRKTLVAVANLPLFKFIGAAVMGQQMVMILSDYNAYLLGIHRVRDNNIQGVPCEINGYDGYLDDYIDIDLENENQQFKVEKNTPSGKVLSRSSSSITKRISDELFATLPTLLAGTAAWIGLIRGIGTAVGAVLAGSGVGIFAGVAVLILTTGAAWLITMMVNKFIDRFETQGRFLTNPLASLMMERFVSDEYINQVCDDGKITIGIPGATNDGPSVDIPAVAPSASDIPVIGDMLPDGDRKNPFEINLNEARQAYDDQEDDMPVSDNSEFKMNRQDAMRIENMFEDIITEMLDELQGPRRAELERLIQRSAAMQNQNRDDERVA
jgi:DNA-directed RNA polymerase specialized sigma24 family protein